MSETVIRSVAEFQEQLQGFESEGTDFLYRGQADVKWKVECSAARRLNRDPTKPIEDQLINLLLVGYLESRIERAKKRNFLPPGFNADSSDLELLAQLQHYGAATGLIDFTSNPLVALWFACNESYARDGAIFLLPRSATKKVDDSSDLKKKIQSFYEKDEIWSWKPPLRGNRIGAQNSVFVLGVPVISRALMRTFTVPAESKQDVLAHLETLCNINEEELFPDFPGYAVSNASNKTYEVSRSVSYWQEQVGLASDKNERAMAHFNYGVACSAIRDFQSAIEQYSEAIALNPGHVRAYTNRGVAKDALERFEDAIADFDEAIRIDPQNDKAYFGRGSAKAELGQYSEAIEDYDGAIRVNPRYATAYLGRGDVQAALGQPQKAIADYNRALCINPEYAEAYNGRGRIKIKLEQYQEAITDFDKAIGVNSKHAEIYYNRGNAKTRLERFKEAIADYDEAIGINPELANAYNSRGAAKAVLDRHAEAIADYDKALFINREHIEAFNNRGLAHKSLGRFSVAIEDFERAQALAKQQGRAELLQLIGRELESLNPKPFQVVPHSSGYVEGIDPNKLKEILCDLDDDQFLEKDAK